MPRIQRVIGDSGFMHIIVRGINRQDLFLEDEDLITARVLDLIQINMRKNRDGDFLIGECCAGLTFRADINKRSYAYEKLYQRILYR